MFSHNFLYAACLECVLSTSRVQYLVYMAVQCYRSMAENDIMRAYMKSRSIFYGFRVLMRATCHICVQAFLNCPVFSFPCDWPGTTSTHQIYIWATTDSKVPTILRIHRYTGKHHPDFWSPMHEADLTMHPEMSRHFEPHNSGVYWNISLLAWEEMLYD